MFCQKCGKKIEGKSSFCNNCGIAIPQASNNNNGLPGWATIVIGVLALIVLVGGCYLIVSKAATDSDGTGDFSNSKITTLSDKKNTNNTTKTTTTTTTRTATEKDIITAKIILLMEQKLAFDTGDYQKGDIPVGTYAFVKFKGSGSYYSEEDLAGNIIDNENFDSFGYVKVHGKGDIETRGVLINITAFGTLGVSGAKEIYEKLNDVKDYYDSGYYKVGTDIPAGTYTIESYGSGYFAVLSGPVGSSSIIRNDNFNGKKTVTVKNGQYLEVHRSTIIKN